MSSVRLQEYIKELIEESGMTINQVANAAGLSNSYVYSLVKNKELNVGKERLIYFGLGLNKPFDSINNLLDLGGYKKLSLDNEDDVNFFLNILEESAKKRRIQGIQMLNNGDLTMSHLLLSVENISGNIVIVNDTPSSTLKPINFINRWQNNSVRENRQLLKINKKIRVLRKKTFLDRVGRDGCHVHNINCEKCLELYFYRYKESKGIEQEGIMQHMFNLIDTIEKYPKTFRYDIAPERVCSNFLFEMNFVKDSTKNNNFLFYVSGDKHPEKDSKVELENKFSGFATDSKFIFSCFDKEYKKIKDAIEECYDDKNYNHQQVIERIKSQFREVTKEEIVDLGLE